MRLTEHPKFRSFVLMFETPFHGEVGSSLFRRWLELTWEFLNAGIDVEGQSFRGETFTQAFNNFTHEEVRRFSDMMFTYFELVGEFGFEDILGPACTLIGATNRHLGQSFTPMEIARLMANLASLDLAEKFATQDVVTMVDPACGSGVMLLAWAEMVHNQLGPTALQKAVIRGVDIDNACVLMSAIQLRAVGADHYAYAARRAGVQYETILDRMIWWVACCREAYLSHMEKVHGADRHVVEILLTILLSGSRGMKSTPQREVPRPNRAERRRIQRELERSPASHRGLSLDLEPDAFLANPTPSLGLPPPQTLALPSR